MNCQWDIQEKNESEIPLLWASAGTAAAMRVYIIRTGVDQKKT